MTVAVYVRAGSALYLSVVGCLLCGQTWRAARPLETPNEALVCPTCERRGWAVETGEEVG